MNLPAFTNALNTLRCQVCQTDKPTQFVCASCLAPDLLRHAVFDGLVRMAK